jgi:hypothetical protein
MAAIYTERCAGCHGAGVEGGRAPSLFDATWKYGGDDESIRKTIHDGITGTEMVGFASSLTDQQIWQLVGYLRTQGETLKAPTYVPDPDGHHQVREADVQDRGHRQKHRDPWGLAFLPDGRLLITERPGRLRIVQDGKLLPDPVKGTPKVWEKQDGGLLDVEVHPQYAKNGWIYLSYSETVPGYVAPPAPTAPAAPTPPAAAGTGAPPSPDAARGAAAGAFPQGGGHGRGGADPPSTTVIVRQDQQEQQ